jgi:hypothetical protein
LLVLQPPLCRLVYGRSCPTGKGKRGPASVAGGIVETDPGEDEDVLLARFSADGAIDKKFGLAGSVEYNATRLDREYVNGMVVRDNRIYIALPGLGEVTTAGVVMRLMLNGARDRAFGGGDGEVRLDFGEEEDAVDLAVQDDGKIVVVGNRAGAITIVRLRADGTFDSAFGTLGVKFFENATNAQSVALQPAPSSLAGRRDPTPRSCGSYRKGAPLTWCTTKPAAAEVI